MTDSKRISDKLDKIESHISNIDISLARQQLILEDHTRRSLANEETISIVKKMSDDRLRSLESHKDRIMGAVAILGVVCSLVLGAKQLGLL